MSRADIEARFQTNSKLIVAARVITAGLSLATIPVLLTRLGVTAYGSWEALFAFASLSSLFQTAVSGTLIWRMSEAYGRDDMAEIRRLARVGGGFCLALFVVLWPWTWIFREPIVRFLGVSPELSQLASQMFPVIAALVLAGGFSETLEAVVSGTQRTGLVNIIGAGAQILNYSVVIVMTILGGGLWSLVGGQATGTLSRLVGAVVVTRVSFGSVSLAPLAPNRHDLSRARYPGLLMVGSMAALLRAQTDKVVLASLAAPSWVAYYGIAARLAGLMMEIISFVYLPILTAVAALNAMGDWDGVKRFYGRLMATVSIVTGVAVVIVAGLSDSLVVLWLGYPIPEVTLLLWWLLAGSATAVILTGPGTAICKGVGQVGIETTYLAFNLVLNLALTILLVIVIGPIGTAVATGVTWALSSILFLFVLHRRLDLPVPASRRACGAAVLAAVLAVIVYLSSQAFGLPGGRSEALVSLLVWGMAGGLAYLGLALLFRLVSINDAYGGLRSLLRSAG